MTLHLRGNVRAYVDRALPPAILHLYDRHLVYCATCRAAADQERRIVACLRSDTGFVPGALRSSLMGLAAAPLPEPATAQGPRIPLGPLARTGPLPVVREPLATVPPTAPALHRSPMRAAVVASLAAGASVAAAWGLAVSPIPGGARVPSARIPAGMASLGAAMSPMIPMAPAAATAGAGRDSTSAGRRAGQAVAPQYWVVSSRTTAPRATVAAPVRVTFVPSAQSGP